MHGVKEVPAEHTHTVLHLSYRLLSLVKDQDRSFF